jgi:hypothetical protein
LEYLYTIVIYYPFTVHECIYFCVKVAAHDFIFLLVLKRLTYNIPHEITSMFMIICLSYFALKGGDKKNNI